MTQARRAHGRTVLVVIGLLLVLAATWGCSPKSTSTGQRPDSPDATKTAEAPGGPLAAKAGIEVARSALSTMAPDAKMLMVQTAEAVTTTSTPVWGYLFGSPKSDKTYVVYVTGGKVQRAEEYGTAEMSAADWASMGADDAFTIDSDEAYKKALAVSGAKTTPPRYLMGLQAYVSKENAEKTGATAYVWYVLFDPGRSGATSETIDVDANTGKAAIHRSGAK